MSVSLSLDIGTRKVIGLLTEVGPKGLRIIAAEKQEHRTRTVFDGQIHDVVEVASVVERIVERLSAKAGARLTEAAVAAAGRALRTFPGAASRELSGLKEMTAPEVFALELEAVQAAQQALAETLREQGQRAQDYHYVGHSVVAHKLDGLSISSLVGQRGAQVETQVIGTFLPRGVVDSLMGVLERVGLEMTALTLEPIAAINVVVPQSMRHLNLVLVDIGAGTSDIAITSKGTVLAYDMVPIAGDEVTEALSEKYLLDFTVGEEVKRQIGAELMITFADILGTKMKVTSLELAEACLPAVDALASQISARVLRLNGGPPQAVLLVGGGSQSPGLPARLAHHLGLPENRVAVRGRDAIANVTGARNALTGPDAVTPIGIAVTASTSSTFGFVYVTVDDRGVRLFNPVAPTVADALLAAGIAIRELQGRVGKGFTVTVNGSLRMVRGTFGRPAQILVNGEPVTLESTVRHRDRIEIIPAVDGAPGSATVGELVSDLVRTVTVMVGGEERQIPPIVTLGGQPANWDAQLQDNDAIQAATRGTVGDVLEYLGYAEPDGVTELRITVQGESRVVRRARYLIRVNGQEVDAFAPVADGDIIEVAETEPITVGELCAGLRPSGAAVRLKVNGEPMEIAAGATVYYRNGSPIQPDETVWDGDRMEVQVADESPPIFAQLLVQMGLRPTPPPGKSRLRMLLNSQPAEFITPLQDGDQAEIAWE